MVKHFRSMTYPYIAWILAIVVAPMLLIVLYAFTTSGNSVLTFQFTFENFARFVTDKVFMDVLLRSLYIAVITTLICIVLGYPIAYVIAQRSSRSNTILIIRQCNVICHGLNLFIGISHSHCQACCLKHGSVIHRVPTNHNLFRHNSKFPGQFQQTMTFIGCRSSDFHIKTIAEYHTELRVIMHFIKQLLSQDHIIKRGQHFLYIKLSRINPFPQIIHWYSGNLNILLEPIREVFINMKCSVITFSVSIGLSIMIKLNQRIYLN